MAEDDDPVVASYDVYLTKPNASGHDTSSPLGTTSSRLLVLQYPAHRSSSKPYNAARSQKPTSLRLKPATGLLELEVPIMTKENYNLDLGTRYGKAIAESRTVQAGGTHGLGGGFSAAPGQPASLRDVPLNDGGAVEQPPLSSQTLGGKITIPNERDPVYLLGSFRDKSLHLSQLDAVVQMRPQLHHIDADEENTQKRYQGAPNGVVGKPKSGLDNGPAKIESKAIEIKIKDNKNDAKDRNLNENARLLREIQMDQWRIHSWLDQDDDAAQAMMNRCLHLQGDLANIGDSSVIHPRLKSALSNGDWLDKMSAPREDGKKGLLAKLRGRERERARRKKAEEEKKLKNKGPSSICAPARGPLMDMSSDSELSSESDIDALGAEHDSDNHASGPVEIKEEPTIAPTAASTIKRRGRPRKSQPGEVIEIGD